LLLRRWDDPEEPRRRLVIGEAPDRRRAAGENQHQSDE
jgi:hypothetical protein